jgi:hypothetical protein
MRTRVLALAVSRDGQRCGRSPFPIRYSACWPGRTREEDGDRRPRRLHSHSSGIVVDEGACARSCGGCVWREGLGKAEYGEASGYPLASFTGQRWHWAAFMRCGATACTRRCSLYLRVRHTAADGCEATRDPGRFYGQRSFFDVAFFLSRLATIVLFVEDYTINTCWN